MANEFLDKAGLQQVWNRILDLFSPKNHSHKIEDTTDLQSTLDGKAALSHTHDDYVTKEEGKELFTDEERDKLSKIENNAQVNDIESISLNGVPQSIDNKNVNLNIDLSPYAEKSELEGINSAIDTFGKSVDALEEEVADWYSKGFDYSKLTDEEKAQIKQDVTTVNAQFSKVYNVSGEQSVFDIGIERYAHGIDILEVYINGMRLVEGVDYSNDGQRITLAKPLNVIGQLEIVVFKSVSANAADLASFKGEKGEKGDSASLEDISTYLDDYLPLSGGVMTGSIDMDGNNIADISKVQSIASDGAVAETIFAPYYSYSTLGVTSGDYESFFRAWLKKMATLYPNIKASIISQATPAYRSFIVCYMQSTTLTTDGYPKYASGMFFSYKENEAYHFLFDNGTFKMNKVVTGNVYSKSEVDDLIANAGGGGSSESTNKALRIIAGSEDSGDKNSFNINSDAELDAFIETSIVKWAKYRGITNGLPNGDGLVQAIGWRSPTDGAGWGRQIAYDDESHNIYSRYLGNGSWSAWKKVLVDGDSAPASDVHSWAKASSKPSYNASEVGAVPTSRTVNGKALSGNITLSASDVGAGAKSTYYFYDNSTTSFTLPSMSVGEIKLVSLRNSNYEEISVRLPSGGTYAVICTDGSIMQGKTYSGNAYIDYDNNFYNAIVYRIS